ncbi:unnamed protein product [Durusdinium trenchii]|uniref:Sulfotransferase n=1 Tax=Durusdinium trenchii TaxID=1381693 RepID=A0ABP0LC92_9DINO
MSVWICPRQPCLSNETELVLAGGWRGSSTGGPPQVIESHQPAMAVLFVMALLGLADADGSSLLQTRYSPGESEKDLKGCLSFIHIPKTMGGSIELARLRAAGLLWTNTNYCLGRLEAAGHHREEPGAQWGTCDANIPCSHVQVNEHHGMHCSQPDLFNDTWCSAWHFPPSFDPQLVSYYADICDSFCVVRHPLDRFISQYRYWRKVAPREGPGFCSAEQLELFAMKGLAKQLNLLAEDCHLVPQVYYAFQDGNPQSKRICRHVLNMTDAAEQFPKLMQRYGLENVTLEGVHEHDPDDGCGEIAPTTKTIELVKQFYHQDYTAFGFV